MSALVAIPKNIKKKIDKNILFVTGSSRSGTSLIGNLIASCDKVQYFYEPETFWPILFIKKKINFNYWKLIFDTYLYHELIKNSLCNRRVNLNTKDESYIFKYKSKDTIRKENLKQFDLVDGKNFNYSKIVIKLPDLISEIMELKKYNSNYKVIFIDRDPIETAFSISKKKWFTSKLFRIFPIIKYKSKLYPWWLNKKKYKYWDSLNNYERSALYVIQMREIMNKNKKVTKFYYNSLVENPKKFFNKLKSDLNLKPTKRTFAILNSIGRKKNTNKIYHLLRKKISPKIFAKLSI